MLSFGTQGWSKQRAISPSAVSPIALIVLLREVKRSLCTYLGASSQSQKCKRCSKGKTSSGAPCSPVNSSSLNLSLGFCVIILPSSSHISTQSCTFLNGKLCAIRSIHCMPRFHTLWDSELFFFNHLGHNNFSHNPTLSRRFLQLDDSHLFGFPHLGSPLAPSLYLFQLNSNPFGSLGMVWSWSTWQLGMCWICALG